MNRATVIAVKQPLTLCVNGKDHTLEFPLSAVMVAEEKVGHSLKSPSDWFGAPAKDIPALLFAGLQKHQPEVTEAEVQELCDSLGPESITEVTEALGAMAFPRFLERYKANLDKLKGGADTKE